jgi:predicted dinucleotide-utilizing enzyme
VLASLALVGASPALADHHLVKRALQEARCTPASLKQMDGASGTLVYQAVCSGAAGRVLTIVCTTERCFPDDHAAHAQDDED